jgi:hypothetical protein
VKVLARAHQSMIWSRGRQTNALRSTLREFYPAALVAFDDLASGDATEVLKIAPTPSLGAGCRSRRSPPHFAAVADSVASTSELKRSRRRCAHHSSRDLRWWQTRWVPR